MQYTVSCRLDYTIPGPSTFVFNIAPPDTKLQCVETESLTVMPELPVEEFAAPDTGNRYHRLEAADGTLTVLYSATVVSKPAIMSAEGILTTPPSMLPQHTLPYVLPSRYCESDQLMRLAWREFGDMPETIERPARIADWVHDNVDYLLGSTGPRASAFNTVTARAGVCRDFAHLGIAFCRAMNIPARFVSAYAFDLWPPDFHAVFEAWLDGRWYLFDPTRLTSRAGLIRLGTGRDAADVSFALIFGPAIMTGIEVSATPCEAEGALPPRPSMTCAISSA